MSFNLIYDDPLSIYDHLVNWIKVFLIFLCIILVLKLVYLSLKYFKRKTVSINLMFYRIIYHAMIVLICFYLLLFILGGELTLDPKHYISFKKFGLVAGFKIRYILQAFSLSIVCLILSRLILSIGNKTEST